MLTAGTDNGKNAHMKRVLIDPRKDADRIASESGVFRVGAAANGRPYRTWDETSGYVFQRNEVDQILDAVTPVVDMVRDAVDFLLDGQWGTLGYTRPVFEFIRESFDDEQIELYTRYDFAYLGNGSVKLVGINGDSPRGLIEAAQVQRKWLRDKFGAKVKDATVTQLNSIPELSVRALSRLALTSNAKRLHVTHSNNGEDMLFASYMKGMTTRSGWRARMMRSGDFGWGTREQSWLDPDDERMKVLYKHMPWDLMMKQSVFRDMMTHGDVIQSLEPAWKMVLNNRAILPALWHLYPNNPILSPASIETRSRSLGEDVVTSSLLPSVCRNEMGSLRGRTFTSWGEQMKDLSDQRDVAYRSLVVPRRFRDVSGGYRFSYLSLYTVAGNPAAVGMRETRLPLLGAHTTFKPHLVVL